MAAPNPQIPIEARQTVLDMIVANQSFTAYEITLEVRRRLGTSVEVPHPIVNSVVQTMFSGGEIIGYTRAPDATVNAANPPFRYSPQGAPAPVAASVGFAPTPSVPAINRLQLPEPIRGVLNPQTALARAYCVEARAFHEVAGIASTPFSVWLPTSGDLHFRVRSYGIGLSEADVEDRYSLSAATHSNWNAKAAFAHADSFRITSYRGGVATRFRAVLDVNLVAIVAKEDQHPTSEADGMAIEVPIRASNLARLQGQLASVLSFFHVAPIVHNLPKGVSLERPRVVVDGGSWRLTEGARTVAVMGDEGFVINTTLPLADHFSRLTSPVGLELDFAPGELEVSPNGETLLYSNPTRAALERAFGRVDDHFEPLLLERIASAPNLWEAKLRLASPPPELGEYGRRLTGRLARTFVWNTIRVENNLFWHVIPSEATVLLSLRVAGSVLRTRRETRIEAKPDHVVFFNDLNTRTGNPARMREFFAANPDVKGAYILTFASDAAKDAFIADNHFESVPVRLISTLPKPASTQVRIAKTPFDPAKHGQQRPQNPLVAAGFDGNGDFGVIQKWAREVVLDGVNWPDFKRLYKHIEGRVWPLQTRNRWKADEADLPSGAPQAGENELILLGLLIARLAETGDSANSNRAVQLSSVHSGPTRATLAYMGRRAEKLLVFLRDRSDLSSSRREEMAPIVAGIVQRERGLDWAMRLDLVEGELGKRPDLIERLWSEATLSIPVLKWAFAWLRARGIEARAQPAHIQVLLREDAGFELALQCLPPLLASGAGWPAAFTLADVSRALEQMGKNPSLLPSVLALFARFEQLQASIEWLRTSLGGVTQADPLVFAWASWCAQAQARQGDFSFVLGLSESLRDKFNAALVQFFPRGLGEGDWQKLIGLPGDVRSALAPALQKLPISPEIAVLLWALPEAERAAWIGVLGQAKFTGAFAATLELRARAGDFPFAASLSSEQQALFFDVLARDANGLSPMQWRQLDALGSSLDSLSPGLSRLPLEDGFWEFFFFLGAQERAPWLERVEVARAASSFGSRPPSEAAALLEGDTTGVEPLLDAWIEANLSRLASDEEFVTRLATGDNTTWREAALAQLSRRSLSLPVALRLVESGLPDAQTLARDFFEADNPDWAERVVALCDSPSRDARRDALKLLTRFSSRWTPELLTQLAEHDDPLIQSFVASHLKEAPQSVAVVAFETAILNTRGRSRRAKNQVQAQLNQRPQLDAARLESLLDAARNGAPRDRAWALQQLVRFKMAGADIGELQLSGAVARAAK